MLRAVVVQHGLLGSYVSINDWVTNWSSGQHSKNEKTHEAIIKINLKLEVLPQIGSTFQCEYLNGTVKKVHHNVGIDSTEYNQYTIELENERDRFDTSENWETLEKNEWINIEWIGEWFDLDPSEKF
jgi:hypothetical protein